jgi:MYXO-CTERM domain-containing protein
VDFNAGGPGLSFGGSGLSYGGNGTVGPGRDKPGPTTAKGCGCRVGGDTDAPSTKLAWLGALLGLGLVLQRRRATRA